MEFVKQDYIWINEPTLGKVLLDKGGKKDSLGDPIKSDSLYEVGKHKSTGKAIIIPTSRKIISN